MGRRRKSPTPVMLKAAERLSGTKSIDEGLDMGSDVSNAKYSAKLEETHEALGEYNESLAFSDRKLNRFNALEKELRELSESMLAGVGSHYGKDSSEYEMAGGTRKSEHKKRTRKKVKKDEE